MAGRITFSILDHSNEVGSMRLYTPDLASGNVDSYVNDSLGGHLGDFRLALSGLIEGNHLRRTVTATVITDTATLPASASAQRERKAMVTYRDTVTGKTYRFEIPTFDMTGAQPGTDVVDTSGVNWQTLINEFEANFVSEVGNPVEVVNVRHVGRSS